MRGCWLFITVVCLSLPTLACNVDLDAPGRLSADKARDTSSKPCAMFDILPVKPQAVVLDLLGGGGYFSELLAQAVGPAGKVYLHNNQAYLPYVSDMLEQRLAAERLPNVLRYDRELNNLELADNSLDAVFFIMGYHDMYHTSSDWHIEPALLMAQVHRALKPNGLMLIVDHNAAAGSGSSAAQQLHRIEQQFVQQDLQKFGFTVIKSSDVLSNPADNYSQSVFDKAIRGNTDRFVLLVQKTPMAAND